MTAGGCLLDTSQKFDSSWLFRHAARNMNLDVLLVDVTTLEGSCVTLTICGMLVTALGKRLTLAPINPEVQYLYT